MKERKIAFFDLDGTITSERDGTIPSSAIEAIRRAKEQGHLLFVNSGRTYCAIEPRFKDIGFDGYVCGCGTNIFYGEEELLRISQTREVTSELIHQARKTDVDLALESKTDINFDLSRELHHPDAKRIYEYYIKNRIPMSSDIESENYICDKFVIWFERESQLTEFREVSDQYFECIDRGGNFREFVPLGYSKASGIQYLLDYFTLKDEQAYAFGDSNNDLSMLTYVKHSVAMGNAEPEELKNMTSFVTKNASEDGIYFALEQLGFFL